MLEHQNGRISPSSFPVISAAKELSNKVSALIAGGSDLKLVIGEAAQIPGLNKVYSILLDSCQSVLFGQVYTAQNEVLEHHLAEPVADLLASVQQQ